jgi:hypothetical protein
MGASRAAARPSAEQQYTVLAFRGKENAGSQSLRLRPLRRSRLDTVSGRGYRCGALAAPTTIQALAQGARAAGRSAWLVAPGLLVTFLRSALGWPALLFAVGIAQAGAAGGLAAYPRPGPLLAGAIRALTAPRTLLILAGLWLAGQLASAALRVAWLAGALPALGEELARPQEPRARFAEGIAFGFAPLLGTALLALLVELAAQLCALAMCSAIALTGFRHAGGAYPVAAALLAAGALTVALAMPMVASLVADAALARTALLRDGPARALAEAMRRVVLRPGAFLVAGLALGVVAAALLGSAKVMETAALGVAHGAPVLLVLGPRLMASVLGAALAVLVELWRLGTVAALACGEA